MNTDFQEMGGIGNVERIDLAQNVGNWRVLVNAVMTLRAP